MRLFPGVCVSIVAAAVAALAVGQQAPVPVERPVETSPVARSLELAAAALERDRREIPARSAALAEESASARNGIEAQRNDLVTVSAGDDALALQAIQMEIAALDAKAGAAEEEKSYWDKRLEESQRERDAWTRRAQSLELARRLELKALLATRSEVAARERAIEAARKELDYQASQVRKYVSRQETAAARWEDGQGRLRAALRRMKNLSRQDAAGQHAGLNAAAGELVVQLRRARDVQTDWLLLYKSLEDRSWRNLSFARANVRLQQRYVHALATKEAAWKAEDAQKAALAEDQRAAAMQGAADALQADIKKDLAALPAETSVGKLAAGGSAEDRSRARREYTEAAAQRAAGEARTDCLKELVSWQKAVAAFTHEKSDRARSAAQQKSLPELEQEKRVLVESLRTSEEYVQGFTTVLAKLDGQIDQACRSLALPDTERSSVATQVLDQVSTVLDPDGGQTSADLARGLDSLAVQAAGSAQNPEDAARRSASVQMTYRMAQREFMRQRLAIAAEWLANSRAAVAALDRRLGDLLWQQQDPRLSWVSAQELGSYAQSLWHDGDFLVTATRMGIGPQAGYASRRWLAVWLVAALALLLFGLSRRSPGVHPSWMPSVTLAILAAFPVLLFHGNRMAMLATLALGAAAAYGILRALLLRLSSEGRFPPLATLAGGFVVAVRLLLTSSLFLWAAWILVGPSESRDDIRAFILRLWLCFAGYVGLRLLFHPTLAGRLFYRNSKEAWIRGVGAGIAWACNATAVLAILPYVLSLDSLAQTVLRTVVASFALIGAALLAARVLFHLLARRPDPPAWLRVVVRLAQAAVAVAAGGAIFWLWSSLLDRLLLAPNAPEAAHQLVNWSRQAWHLCGRAWHAELTGGMTMASVSRGIVVFALSFWVAKVLKRVFLGRVLSRTPMDESTRQTFATILGYIVIVVGFLVGLNVAGSSLQNLALLAGAVTVGLGFGLQHVINNFVSSLLIHFSRTIRIGDYIEAGGTRGVVREIGLRHTVVVTDDGITVLVPNGSLVGANIINWTNPKPRIRLHVAATITRQADLAAVSHMLIDSALAHDCVLKEPAPTVEVRSVAADRIGLELLAWTAQPQAMARITGDLNLATDRLLREKGLVV